MKSLQFHSLDRKPACRSSMIELAEYSQRNNCPMKPMLVVSPDNVKFDIDLDELCDDIASAGTVRFTGDRRWLSFSFDFPYSSNDFSSFSEMISVMRRFSGYYNSFSGVIHIDLTSWIKHFDDRRMESLFAFIHDYSDDIFFILSISTDDNFEAEKLKRELLKWVYVSVAEVHTFSEENYVAIVMDILAQRGYKIDDSAVPLLRSIVKQLYLFSDFAGTREMEVLATAIAFKVASGETVSEKTLADFAPDSRWMQIRSGADNLSRIGFDGGFLNG